MSFEKPLMQNKLFSFKPLENLIKILENASLGNPFIMVLAAFGN
jgi:hypothetical protein